MYKNHIMHVFAIVCCVILAPCVSVILASHYVALYICTIIYSTENCIVEGYIDTVSGASVYGRSLLYNLYTLVYLYLTVDQSSSLYSLGGGGTFGTHQPIDH